VEARPSARREKGKNVKSRIRLIAGATLVVASVIAGTAGVTLASGHDQTVYRADVMVGVSAPYTGANGTAIRDIHGGGAPWVIADADIRLRASGRIDVEVEGLVIDPAFPNANRYSIDVSPGVANAQSAPGVPEPVSFGLVTLGLLVCAAVRAVRMSARG